MEISLFLAKLFGIYMLTMGVLCVTRGEAIASVVDELFHHRPSLFLSGVIALVIGIAMAIGHSVWEPNWRGLITLFGYLSIAKGVARIGFPDLPKRASSLFAQPRARWIWIGVLFILGGYLTWAGFTQG
jgi:hypothetical protein